MCGFLHVTNPWVYFILFALNGCFQSPVWPGTVAVIGNWFSKSNRGSVMGVWSTNNSVGNILGQQTAAILEQTTHLRWEYIILITLSYVLIAALLFQFVKDKPSVSLLSSNQPIIDSTSLNQANTPEITPKKNGISLLEAWKLPG